MHVAVVDIGKPGKNLGWAIRGSELNDQGGDLDACCEQLAAALAIGPLALGFEAPLFVPLRDRPLSLTQSRAGECANGINRPFSAGAGASVLVTALVVVPYVLSKLKAAAPDARATLNWQTFTRDRHTLLIFEAFVTDQRKAHAERHIDDALAAIDAFTRGIESPAGMQSAVTAPECLSLIGAMLLRTGWPTDADLADACLVVRA